MLRQIIKEYLRENGFVGLVNVEMPCGCEKEGLCPCDCIDIDNCQPARLRCFDPRCGDGGDGDIFYCNRNPETCEYKVGDSK